MQLFQVRGKGKQKIILQDKGGKTFPPYVLME
jgi:hypothetical protein